MEYCYNLPQSSSPLYITLLKHTRVYVVFYFCGHIQCMLENMTAVQLVQQSEFWQLNLYRIVQSEIRKRGILAMKITALKSTNFSWYKWPLLLILSMIFNTYSGFLVFQPVADQKGHESERKGIENCQRQNYLL